MGSVGSLCVPGKVVKKDRKRRWKKGSHNVVKGLRKQWKEIEKKKSKCYTLTDPVSILSLLRRKIPIITGHNCSQRSKRVQKQGSDSPSISGEVPLMQDTDIECGMMIPQYLCPENYYSGRVTGSPVCRCERQI